MDATKSARLAQKLEALDRRHIIHPHLAEDDGPQRIVLTEGKGVHVRDADGQEYLDATGGSLWLGHIGHGRAEMAEVARRQIEKLEFFGSFYNYTSEPAIRLAERLIELATDGIDHVYFTAGGSESNEIALLMARNYHARLGRPERNVILGLKDGYHGITYGARAATGVDKYHKDVGPLPPGFVHLTSPNTYRVENTTETCLAELDQTIERIGADRIAAMIAEPIIGVGGMLVPPHDYWPRVHKRLQELGILLIFDEVVSGFGRTGTWFGAMQWDIKPDFLSTAKGLTSGYFPLGAVLVRDSVAEVVTSGEGFGSGFTFTGHPVGCALALKNIEILERENLLANARDVGAYLRERLETLLEFPTVGAVDGIGLMLGIQLVVDKRTKTPADALGRALGRRFARDTRVFVRNVASALVLSPPLIFERQHCDALIDALRLMLQRSEPDGTIHD